MIFFLLFPFLALASSPPLLGTLHSYNEARASLMSEYFHDDLDTAGRRRVLHSLNESEVSLAGLTGGILYGGLHVLIQKGSKWYSKYSEKHDFLEACRLNDLHTLRTLMSRSEAPSMLVSAKNVNGETALMAACKDGFVEIVEALLEAGADPNERSVLGYSSIIFASRTGKQEVLSVLLRRGVDPNTSGDNGRTAAHWAALLGNISFLKGLLASPEVDLCLRDTTGSTALMLAASEGRLHILQTLIRHSRAHLNLADRMGETALHRAAYRNKLDSLRALLFAGADPTISNREGLCPHQAVSGIKIRGRHGFSPASKLLLLFYNLRTAMGPLRERLCQDVVGEITLKVLALSRNIY